MKKKKMSTKMKEEHEKVMAKHPAGSGERFMHMTKVLKKKGARTPGALAAWIGRKKYGAKKMAEMSKKGKKGKKGKKKANIRNISTKEFEKKYANAKV